MKNSTLKLKVFALILSGLFLVSCQPEVIEPNNQISTPIQWQSLLAVQAGNYISYSAAETCLGDPISVVFNNGYNNGCGNIQIQMSTDGGVTWVQVASGTPVNGTLTYTFTPSAAGSYLFRGKWNATGGPSCSATGSNIHFPNGIASN